MKKVVEGRITSRFGLRIHPITGNESGHNGVDIAAPIGTAVYSPIDGTATINTHSTGGKQVVVTNDRTGLRVGFAHLSAQLVRNNQRVIKGQQVALSGNTGASTGPHLHYTYAINGKKVDPTPFIEF